MRHRICAAECGLVDVQPFDARASKGCRAAFGWFSILLLVSAAGCTKPDKNADTKGSETKQITMAMMPKSKGNAYFISCRKGAEEAAKELGTKLIWDGPTDPDPARQNEIVETWITRGVDVIAVAVENREGISTALRKAREKSGVK